MIKMTLQVCVCVRDAESKKIYHQVYYIGDGLNVKISPYKSGNVGIPRNSDDGASRTILRQSKCRSVRYKSPEGDVISIISIGYQTLLSMAPMKKSLISYAYKLF